MDVLHIRWTHHNWSCINAMPVRSPANRLQHRKENMQAPACEPKKKPVDNHPAHIQELDKTIKKGWLNICLGFTSEWEMGTCRKPSRETHLVLLAWWYRVNAVDTEVWFKRWTRHDCQNIPLLLKDLWYCPALPMLQRGLIRGVLVRYIYILQHQVISVRGLTMNRQHAQVIGKACPTDGRVEISWPTIAPDGEPYRNSTTNTVLTVSRLRLYTPYST